MKVPEFNIASKELDEIYLYQLAKDDDGYYYKLIGVILIDYMKDQDEDTPNSDIIKYIVDARSLFFGARVEINKKEMITGIQKGVYSNCTSYTAEQILSKIIDVIINGDKPITFTSGNKIIYLVNAEFLGLSYDDVIMAKKRICEYCENAVSLLNTVFED